jgi:hypothetical protein
VTTPIPLQLRPEQAAVVSACQRIDAAMALECTQLARIYGQEGMANDLDQVRRQVTKLLNAYVADCNRAVIIASADQLPPVPVNGIIPGHG